MVNLPNFLKKNSLAVKKLDCIVLFILDPAWPHGVQVKAL
jgi:hypothetical protein